MRHLVVKPDAVEEAWDMLERTPPFLTRNMVFRHNFVAAIDTLRAALAAAQADLRLVTAGRDAAVLLMVEAQADRERLDWLQANYAHFCVPMRTHAPWICERRSFPDEVPELRAAIDAARAQPDGETDGGRAATVEQGGE